MDDDQIIELYWIRNETAIKETEHKYGRFCHSIAYNILSVWEDAEECVNDTYQKVWNAIPPQRPNVFHAWLGKIVRNLSLNRYEYNHATKRYAGGDILLGEISDCIPDPGTVEAIIEAKELSGYISNWLDALPETDRALFVRRYWSGVGVSDLAKMIGTSPNKLAGRLFRLRTGLKTYLEEKGVRL